MMLTSKDRSARGKMSNENEAPQAGGEAEGATSSAPAEQLTTPEAAGQLAAAGAGEQAAEAAEAPESPEGASATQGAEAAEGGVSAPPPEEELVWPIEPDHQSALELLSENEPLEVEPRVSDRGLPSKVLNFFLVLLIGLVGAAGVMGVNHFSSEHRLARMSENAFCERDADLARQRLQQKEYGQLIIESTPPRAKLFQWSVDGRWEPIRGTDGAQEQAVTPKTLTNLDVNQPQRFRIEGEGMRPVEISIHRYQWIKDSASGDFNFKHSERLIPDTCENWYSYSWARSEEKSFESRELCDEFVRSAEGQATRCLCRVQVPEAEEEGEGEGEGESAPSRGR